jgi:DeoR/GlpR family transcriptional regulator of sugar metabolism
MRQSAILERIRQNNNCRLKDVQEWLSDVSERTIRYDLQNLIGQGLVERLGNGGPATFYRIRA